LQDIRVVFKRLVMPYFKGYIPYFLLALLGMILSAIGASSSAYLVKPVLDEIFIKKDLELLYLLPYAIVVVYAMKGGGKYIQVYFSALIGHDIIRKVRNRLLENMLRLDISFFQEFRTGELISRNINDVDRIRNVVSTMLPEIGRQALTVVGLLGIVIYQSPKLSFFALILIPLIIYPLSVIGKKLKKISHRSQEKTSDITSNLTEVFNNIEIIKAHASENFEYKKFSFENLNFFKINIKAVKTSELTGPIMETLGAVGVATVIIVGGKEVIDGQMSVGSFFSFLTALFMVYTPIKRISALYNQLQDAVAASERILFILDQKPSIVSTKESSVADVNSLKFEDVKLKYGELEALKGVDFEVKKGEKLALVGDSGGGKSSIVNLVIRFFDPTSGKISIDAQNIEEFSLESLRNSISMVTQRVYIFNDSVAANVAYGKEIDKERVLESLRQANALEFVEQMGGIDVVLDENGTNLSGGQRQRIAIARALYVDPKILIFDEATSALDSKSEKKISEAIENITKSRITIIIAHRLSTVKSADKIAVLKGGKIVCMDKEVQLLENCDEYKRLAGTLQH